MSGQAFNLSRPTRRKFLAGAGAASAALASGMTSILKAAPVNPTLEETSAPARPAVAEPNMKTALGWWCEMPGKWTPVANLGKDLGKIGREISRFLALRNGKSPTESIG